MKSRVVTTLRFLGASQRGHPDYGPFLLIVLSLPFRADKCVQISESIVFRIPRHWTSHRGINLNHAA